MSDFGIWTLFPGILLVVVNGFALAAPGQFRKAVTNFPRNRWAGRILATIALLWAGWLVYKMPLGNYEHLKRYLYIVVPAVIAGVFYYMDELLAPRALGGLLLLYPAPVLALARLSDSKLSVIMSVICYIMVVKGMILVLNPWWFRKAAAIMTSPDTRLRIAGITGLAVGLLLVTLALTSY